MNRVARLLAVAGLGLGTALAIGAGPAQAAPATAQGSQTVTGGHYGYDDDEVVGYFRSWSACERVGRMGEWRDRWDDYDCDRVGFGHSRRGYVLTVEDWNDGYDNDNWYGGWYNSYRGGDFGWYRGGNTIIFRR
ncbi:hypothetical protein [Paractinoplanes maris]|uniref:hypothetical protein n=1 Tax=Paractinoplanes maris TaxID=1734446 RepID=UPI0020217CC2|nr:hypothetical protein [Actinoplanes maris]